MGWVIEYLSSSSYFSFREMFVSFFHCSMEKLPFDCVIFSKLLNSSIFIFPNQSLVKNWVFFLWTSPGKTPLISYLLTYIKVKTKQVNDVLFPLPSLVYIWKVHSKNCHCWSSPENCLQRSLISNLKDFIFSRIFYLN